LFDGLGDDRGLAAVLVCRSEAEMKVGDYALSAALLERVVAIGKAIGDDEIAVWGETWLFSPVFARAVVDGDREAAERSHVLAEANVVRSEAGRWGSSSLDRALALSELAASLFALGEYADSVDAAQRSLREMPQMEMNSGQLMWPVLTLGLSACASGDSGRGITLIAAERKQLREDGLTEDSWLGPVLERIEPQARAALGDDRYEAAVRAGEALSRDDAIELALSPIDTSPIPDEQAPTG
jgi:hypothetical protein